MNRLNTDGTGEATQIASSSYSQSPFLDVTGTTSSPVSEVPPTLNLETRNHGSAASAPPARILLCFIDRKAAGQTAHYALVPLPSSYETAMDLAFEAFQSQFLESNVLSNFEIVLMIKCNIRLGDASGTGAHSTTIWANIHPVDQWASIVRDGDEILVCPKLPPRATVQRQRTVSFAPAGDQATQTAGTNDPPLTEAGSKVVFCHKPHKEDAFKNETVPFVQSFQTLKESAHSVFASSKKSSKVKNWSVEHIHLYLNTTPAAVSGSLPRPNGHTHRKLLDNNSWPSLAYEVARDPNFFWEVEVIYEAKK